MTIRRALFWCVYFSFLLVSVFVIVAPRPLLERTHVHLWSWALLIPVVWWLVGYVRSLRRGDE